MKALELRREDRFQSAAAMRDALAAARGVAKAQKPPSVVRPTPEPVAKPAVPQPQVNAAPKSEPQSVKPQEQKAAPVVTDEPLLLEVEPVHTSAAPVDVFEWSEEELYVSEPPTRKAKSSIHDSIDVDFGMKPAGSPNFKFIAAGAGALIVVVAIIGWVFIGGSPAPQQAVETKPQQVQSAPPQEQAPVSTYGTANANTATQAPQTEAPSSASQPPAAENPAANTAGASKQKKPTATPAKTPEKKKVTVDDLINDN